MLQYILECIAFQLLFLIIYDLFLKGETFFQWNRVYLLGTYLFSLVLPLVKIEAFRKQVPQAFTGYPEFWWRLQDEEINVRPLKTSFIQLSWQEWVLYSGMLLSTLLFCAKLLQLYRLKKQGKHIKYTDFTQIIIADSAMAFSFFRSIFLGDKVVAKNHESIIAHELVHIKQGHTYDLLFFELMRIVSWFNPLVYIFQKRTSELHEFIADAQVAKERKSEHYQQLLSQVFQTEHISFINQFFTKSLIKKRIVMLQKSKSRNVFKLKYLLLIPLVLGMLFYTSCESETKTEEELFNEAKLKANTQINFTSVDEVPVFPGCENEANKRACFNAMIQKHIGKNFSYPEEAQVAGIEGRVNVIFMIDAEGNIDELRMRGPNVLLENEVERIINKLPKMEPAKHDGKSVAIPFSIPVVFKLKSDEVAKTKSEDYVLGDDVPFAIADEVPIFPGCENADNKRTCFNEKIQKHIGKNFNYPSKAQEAGIQGRVNVMFTISSKGTIENITMRGPDKLLEDEVERIIKKLPKMTAGEHQGNAANVPFSIPVNFKLE